MTDLGQLPSNVLFLTFDWIPKECNIPDHCYFQYIQLREIMKKNVITGFNNQTAALKNNIKPYKNTWTPFRQYPQSWFLIQQVAVHSSQLDIISTSFLFPSSFVLQPRYNIYYIYIILYIILISINLNLYY